jgi:putative FmdB family regulatory protein
MPTYEFICPQGHDFDKFYRSMSAAPTAVECPVCGATAERKVSGGSGLVFKGSGFYITDYGKDGKKDQRKAASDIKTSDSKPGDSKPSDGNSSDSKPSDSKPAEAKSGGESPQPAPPSKKAE